MKKFFKKGFTLVELVVSIAVIAILTGTAVGAYFGVTESAKHSNAETEAKLFYTEVTTGVILNQEFTTNLTGGKECKYNVSITTKNWQFSYYSTETLNHFVDAISSKDNFYDAFIGNNADLTRASTAESDNTDKARVYFFNSSYKGSSNTAQVNYFAYIPQGYDGSYAKFIDVNTGNVVSDPSVITGVYEDKEYNEEIITPIPTPSIKGERKKGYIYAYLPEFVNRDVYVNMWYSDNGNVMAYSARNFDYCIDSIAKGLFRVSYDYAYGYDNYIQFGSASVGSVINEHTEELLVTDGYLDSSIAWFEIPGAKKWDSFDIEGYSGNFSYYLVGNINNVDLWSTHLGKYGLAKNGASKPSDSGVQYSIERVYLKSGDLFKIHYPAGNKWYGFDNLDSADSNMFQEGPSDGNIQIKDGWDGYYSFYIKPNSSETEKIYATVDLDNKDPLYFDSTNDINITTSADSADGYKISTPQRVLDSASSFKNAGSTIKFKFKLSGNSNYNQEFITGNLSITITDHSSNANFKNGFKTKITTTKGVFYNPNITDPYKNEYHKETIGNGISSTSNNFINNITVWKDEYNLNSFEHVIEIYHDEYTSQVVDINIHWGDAENSCAYIAGKFGENGEWVTKSDYRMYKNIFYSGGHYVQGLDSVKATGQYSYENFVYDKDVEIKPYFKGYSTNNGYSNNPASGNYKYKTTQNSIKIDVFTYNQSLVDFEVNNHLA